MFVNTIKNNWGLFLDCTIKLTSPSIVYFTCLIQPKFNVFNLIFVKIEVVFYNSRMYREMIIGSKDI